MKSERLTERIGNGVRYDNGEYIITCYPKNNNLTPIDKLAVKLCEFEDKKESGLLFEIPCKPGDEVYAISGDKAKKIRILEIIDAYHDGVRKPLSIMVNYHCDRQCAGCRFGIWVQNDKGERWCNGRYGYGYIEVDGFGKTVFLSQEEALKALKERSEGK